MNEVRYNPAPDDRMHPGAPDAIAAGCTCDPDENHHGRGTKPDEPRTEFIETLSCPLHGINGALTADLLLTVAFINNIRVERVEGEEPGEPARYAIGVEQGPDRHLRLPDAVTWIDLLELHDIRDLAALLTTFIAQAEEAEAKS